MKLGKMATVAVLAAAMTFGGAVTAADAGSMKKKQTHTVKRSHAPKQKKRVYIDPNVSTKNLRALKRQLERSGKHQAARNEIADEIYHGGRARGLGIWLGDQPASQQILGLGIIGTPLGPKKRSGHR